MTVVWAIRASWSAVFIFENTFINREVGSRMRTHLAYLCRANFGRWDREIPISLEGFLRRRLGNARNLGR